MKWKVFLKAWQDACGLHASESSVTLNRSSWKIFSVSFIALNNQKKLKSSKAQVLSTCNWWESHHMYFPHVNNRREYILEMNDYHDTHQPWKNAKNDIMALINICTLTWVRSGMSPWSIPTCWVYKKRKKNNKYALLHAVARKINSDVWMLHRN